MLMMQGHWYDVEVLLDTIIITIINIIVPPAPLSVSFFY